MARTVITPQEIKAPFADIAAGAIDFTLAAGDAVNGNYFVCTGREILIAQNSDGANPYTIGVDSVDDEKNRQEDLTAYSLAAGDFAVFGGGLTNSKGWKQTNGQIYVDVENAAVKLAVLRLPAGVGR